MSERAARPVFVNWKFLWCTRNPRCCFFNRSYKTLTQSSPLTLITNDCSIVLGACGWMKFNLHASTKHALQQTLARQEWF